MSRFPSCVINPDVEAGVGAGEPLAAPPPRGGSDSSRPPGGAAPLRVAASSRPAPTSGWVRRMAADGGAAGPAASRELLVVGRRGGERSPRGRGWEPPRPRGAEPLSKLSWVPPAAGSGAAGLSPAAPRDGRLGRGGVGSACGEPPGSGLGGFLGRRAGSPPLVRTSRGV